MKITVLVLKVRYIHEIKKGTKVEHIQSTLLTGSKHVVNKMEM